MLQHKEISSKKNCYKEPNPKDPWMLWKENMEWTCIFLAIERK